VTRVPLVSVAALNNSDEFLDHLIAEIRKHINKSGEPVTTPDIAVSMVGAIQLLDLDPEDTEDLLDDLLLLIATALQRLVSRPGGARP
jgi:hypothetical protein